MGPSTTEASIRPTAAMSNLSHFKIIVVQMAQNHTIGGIVIKSMWCVLCEVTMAHAKFGVNMPKHCRDTASSVVLASCLKFISVACKTVLSINTKFTNLCKHGLKMIWFDSSENRTNLGFQHKTQWRTGNSAFYNIIGIYVVGMTM